MSPVLCLVTDRQRWGESWREALVGQARAAARAGVHLIQVREPDLEGGALREVVVQCLAAVRGTPARVVVNDRLDVALAAGADGVHLRETSISAARVRAHCPRPFLIGQSVHSAAAAAAVDAACVDYLIFGTVFATSSKPGRNAAGVAALAAAAAATTVPVLAIGGMTASVIPEVMNAGAAGIAGIGLFTAASWTDLVAKDARER